MDSMKNNKPLSQEGAARIKNYFSTNPEFRNMIKARTTNNKNKCIKNLS